MEPCPKFGLQVLQIIFKYREETEIDLHVLGVRRWRELVADRKKWKYIVRQVKAHSGLWCQWKKKNNT